MAELPLPCFPPMPDAGLLRDPEIPVGLLNRLAEARGLVTGGGRPLRFVDAAGAGGAGYEQRAFLHGEVETRPANRHDACNAIAWLAMPLTKAVINRRHAQAILAAEAAGRPERGVLRDALTQLDECGVLVCHADPPLWELVRRHRWREVFHDRRAGVLSAMRFLVLGHASLEALERPFRGLCGKAVAIEVSHDWMRRSPQAQWEDADARLAAWIADAALRPADLQPLPFLGIPGLTPDSEHGDYYNDISQFRPPRRPAGPVA
ncbi:MAG: DUF3025 domain-containing protein [Rhodocyclaceae bacterium]|nr:DUF3025 domain-containing protein [Rhodocyclaceae bacterium]